MVINLVRFTFLERKIIFCQVMHICDGQVLFGPVIVYVRHRYLTCINPIDSVTRQTKSYLPGTGESMISEADPPGRGPSIALRLG